MPRTGALCLLVFLVGCSDLLEVPPPPVPLSILESRQAAVGGGGGATSAPRHRVRLLRAIPPGAIATLHLPDIGGTIRRFRETALYRVLSSPQFQRLLGPAGAKFSAFEMAGLPAGGGGPNPQRLMKALQGEAIVSLIDVDMAAGPQPRVLGAITVHGAERDVEQLIEMGGLFAASDRNIKVEKGTVHGTAFTRFVATKPVPFVVEVALHKGALLAGVGRETVTNGIERLENREGGSLDDDPDYQRAMERCADPRDAFRVQLDIGGLWSRFGSLLPAEANRIVRALALDKIKGLGFAVRLEGPDIVVSSLLDSPGGKDVFTRLFSSHPVNRRFFELIPADATAFSLFAVDGLGLLSQLRGALDEKSRKEMESGLEELRRDGLDIERDILEVFGPRCAIINVPYGVHGTRGLEAVWNQFLGAAFVTEVQDRDRARKALTRIPDGDDTVRRRQRTIEGNNVVSYRFDNEMLPNGFALCYALVDDHLYVAFSEEAMRKVVKPRSPKTAERFRDLFKDTPESVSVLSYDDMSTGLGVMMDAMMAGFASGLEQSGNGPVHYEFGALSELTRGLPHSISFTVADERGIYSCTRSPTGGFGSMGGVTGLAVVASIAIPNLAQARVAANETSAIATLRQIQTAQETFRENQARDDDDDGTGEYGTLAELLGRPRRGEKRARNRNPLLTTFKRGATGDYQRSGYYFRVYLPAEDGSPVGDHEKAKRLRQIDGDLAESVMVVIAWPTSGTSGRRAFILDASGSLFGCYTGGYTGDNPPPPDAIYSQKGNLASAPRGRQDSGSDGHLWHQVR